MTWWRPWTWWPKPRRPASSAGAAARAQDDARAKLEDARAQWSEVREVTDRFQDAVAAALARRHR